MDERNRKETEDWYKVGKKEGYRKGYEEGLQAGKEGFITFLKENDVELKLEEVNPGDFQYTELSFSRHTEACKRHPRITKTTIHNLPWQKFCLDI